MKVVFAHDHRLRCIDGKYYSLGGLSDHVTKRYSNIFGEITLLCRAVPKCSSDSNLSLIQNPFIKIKAISSASLMMTSAKLNLIQEEVRNADSVISRLPSIIGLLAIYYAKKYGKPYLTEVVADTFGSYWYKGVKGKIVAIPLDKLIKREIFISPFVLYVSTDFLQKKYPNKHRSIGCSDVCLQKSDEYILNRRIQKINNGGKFIVGTIGQVDQRYKGQALVIKAISELKKKGIIFYYKLAGSGDNSYLKKVAIKNNVDDQIEFCGSILHEDIYNWIDSIDIYIQPSKTEGMPRAVIESISRGCPTIVSSAGGMYELIEDRYIFPLGNYKKIAELLYKLDKKELLNMAKKNFEYSKNYDFEILDNYRNSFYWEFKGFVEKRICNDEMV